MSAQVLPMYIEPFVGNSKDRRQSYYEHLDGVPDALEGGAPMEKLWEITESVFKNKSEILGQMALGLIASQHPGAFENF